MLACTNGTIVVLIKTNFNLSTIIKIKFCVILSHHRTDDLAISTIYVPYRIGNLLVIANLSWVLQSIHRHHTHRLFGGFDTIYGKRVSCLVATNYRQILLGIA